MLQRKRCDPFRRAASVGGGIKMRPLKTAPAVSDGSGRLCARHEQPHLPAANAVRQFETALFMAHCCSSRKHDRLWTSSDDPLFPREALVENLQPPARAERGRFPAFPLCRQAVRFGLLESLSGGEGILNDAAGLGQHLVKLFFGDVDGLDVNFGKVLLRLAEVGQQEENRAEEL